MITSVIVGAKRPDQLEDNIAATRLVLSEDEIAQRDDISRLPPEYPHWMAERQSSQRIPQPKA